MCSGLLNSSMQLSQGKEGRCHSTSHSHSHPLMPHLLKPEHLDACHGSVGVVDMGVGVQADGTCVLVHRLSILACKQGSKYVMAVVTRGA